MTHVILNQYGHSSTGALPPGVVQIERTSEWRRLRHGKLEWIEWSEGWRDHAVDPALGEARAYLAQSALRRDAGQLEAECCDYVRESAIAPLPLSAIDPARLALMESVFVEYALACSVSVSDYEREKAERAQRWGEPGTKGFARRSNSHAGVWTDVPEGGQAYIDRRMVPVLRTLWNAGVSTSYSCEGGRREVMYLTGGGTVPEALLTAWANAGMNAVRTPFDWRIYASSPRHAHRAFHDAAWRALDDLVRGGLDALDATGARYRPVLPPPPSLPQWLAALRRATRRAEQRRVRKTHAAR